MIPYRRSQSGLLKSSGSRSGARLVDVWFALRYIVWCLARSLRKLWDLNPVSLLLRRWRQLHHMNSLMSLNIRPSLSDLATDFFLSDDRRKRKLLSWVNSILPLGGEDVFDFTTCWQDGIVFCSLMEAIHPGACPRFNQLKPHHRVNNCRLGLQMAMMYLQVKQLPLSPEEMAIADNITEDKICHIVQLLKWKYQKHGSKPTLLSIISVEEPMPCKCHARGTGIRAGIVGRRAKFNILTETISSLELQIEIKGPNNEYNKENIVNVKTGTKAPYRKKDAISTDPTPVEDTKSKIIEDGAGHIFMRQKSLDEDSGHVVIPFDCKCGGEGRFLITYIPRSAGPHYITILSGGVHIQGSPFEVKVSDWVSSWNLVTKPRVSPLDMPQQKHKETVSPEARTGRTMTKLSQVAQLSTQLSRMKKRILRKVIASNGEEIICEVTPSPIRLKIEDLDISDGDRRGLGEWDQATKDVSRSGFKDIQSNVERSDDTTLNNIKDSVTNRSAYTKHRQIQFHRPKDGPEIPEIVITEDAGDEPDIFYSFSYPDPDDLQEGEVSDLQYIPLRHKAEDDSPQSISRIVVPSRFSSLKGSSIYNSFDEAVFNNGRTITDNHLMLLPIGVSSKTSHDIILPRSKSMSPCPRASDNVELELYKFIPDKQDLIRLRKVDLVKSLSLDCICLQQPSDFCQRNTKIANAGSNPSKAPSMMRSSISFDEDRFHGWEKHKTSSKSAVLPSCSRTHPQGSLPETSLVQFSPTKEACITCDLLENCGVPDLLKGRDCLDLDHDSNGLNIDKNCKELNLNTDVNARHLHQKNNCHDLDQTRDYHDLDQDSHLRDPDRNCVCQDLEQDSSGHDLYKNCSRRALENCETYDQPQIADTENVTSCCSSWASLYDLSEGCQLPGCRGCTCDEMPCPDWMNNQTQEANSNADSDNRVAEHVEEITLCGFDSFMDKNDRKAPNVDTGVEHGYETLQNSIRNTNYSNIANGIKPGRYCQKHSSLWLNFYDSKSSDELNSSPCWNLNNTGMLKKSFSFPCRADSLAGKNMLDDASMTFVPAVSKEYLRGNEQTSFASGSKEDKKVEIDQEKTDSNLYKIEILNSGGLDKSYFYFESDVRCDGSERESSLSESKSGSLPNDTTNRDKGLWKDCQRIVKSVKAFRGDQMSREKEWWDVASKHDSKSAESIRFGIPQKETLIKTSYLEDDEILQVVIEPKRNYLNSKQNIDHTSQHMGSLTSQIDKSNSNSKKGRTNIPSEEDYCVLGELDVLRQAPDVIENVARVFQPSDSSSKSENSDWSDNEDATQGSSTNQQSGRVKSVCLVKGDWSPQFVEFDCRDGLKSRGSHITNHAGYSLLGDPRDNVGTDCKPENEVTNNDGDIGNDVKKSVFSHSSDLFSHGEKLNGTLIDLDYFETSMQTQMKCHQIDLQRTLQRHTYDECYHDLANSRTNKVVVAPYFNDYNTHIKRRRHTGEARNNLSGEQQTPSKTSFVCKTKHRNTLSNNSTSCDLPFEDERKANSSVCDIPVNFLLPKIEMISPGSSDDEHEDNLPVNDLRRHVTSFWKDPNLSLSCNDREDEHNWSANNLQRRATFHLTDPNFSLLSHYDDPAYSPENVSPTRMEYFKEYTLTPRRYREQVQVTGNFENKQRKNTTFHSTFQEIDNTVSSDFSDEYSKEWVQNDVDKDNLKPFPDNSSMGIFLSSGDRILTPTKFRQWADRPSNRVDNLCSVPRRSDEWYFNKWRQAVHLPMLNNTDLHARAGTISSAEVFQRSGQEKYLHSSKIRLISPEQTTSGDVCRICEDCNQTKSKHFNGTCQRGNSQINRQSSLSNTDNRHKQRKVDGLPSCESCISHVEDQHGDRNSQVSNVIKRLEMGDMRTTMVTRSGRTNDIIRTNYYDNNNINNDNLYTCQSCDLANLSSVKQRMDSGETVSNASSSKSNDDHIRTDFNHYDETCKYLEYMSDVQRSMDSESISSKGVQLQHGHQSLDRIHIDVDSGHWRDMEYPTELHIPHEHGIGHLRNQSMLHQQGHHQYFNWQHKQCKSSNNEDNAIKEHNHIRNHDPVIDKDQSRSSNSKHSVIHQPESQTQQDRINLNGNLHQQCMSSFNQNPIEYPQSNLRMPQQEQPGIQHSQRQEQTVLQQEKNKHQGQQKHCMPRFYENASEQLHLNQQQQQSQKMRQQRIEKETDSNKEQNHQNMPKFDQKAVEGRQYNFDMYHHKGYKNALQNKDENRQSQQQDAYEYLNLLHELYQERHQESHQEHHPEHCQELGTQKTTADEIMTRRLRGMRRQSTVETMDSGITDGSSRYSSQASYNEVGGDEVSAFHEELNLEVFSEVS